MIETLSRLLSLQGCDQRIQQLTHTLDALRLSLVVLKEEEQARAQDIQAWQDKIKEGEKARDLLTLEIEQVKVQLRKQRGALHRRRAGQQEEAVQREIVLLEASKTALEDELRTVTAQIAQDLEALRQAEARAADHQEKAAGKASSIVDQSAVVEEELRVARNERSALTTGISACLLQEYERIFARRGGVAVVALANETCQGCHMHLPPQMCLEFQRSPGLAFCPHCHRILFVPLETNLHVVEPRSPVNSTDGHHPHRPRQQARSKARTAKEPDGAAVPPANPAQV